MAKIEEFYYQSDLIRKLYALEIKFVLERVVASNAIYDYICHYDCDSFRCGYVVSNPQLLRDWLSGYDLTTDTIKLVVENLYFDIEKCLSEIVYQQAINCLNWFEIQNLEKDYQSLLQEMPLDE